jgi:hypothetical protein
MMMAGKSMSTIR